MIFLVTTLMVVYHCIITSNARDSNCACDFSSLYRAWIPCKYGANPCPFKYYTDMVRKSSRRFCPTGCRCYHGGSWKVHGHGSDVLKWPTSSEKEMISIGMENAYSEPETSSLCDLYKVGNPHRGKMCAVLGDWTAYATHENPDKLEPYFSCHMAPLSGSTFKVRSMAEKYKIIALLKKWGLFSVWAERGHYRDVAPRKCHRSEKCMWGFKCRKCCLTLDATGYWRYASCDSPLRRICGTKLGTYASGNYPRW